MNTKSLWPWLLLALVASLLLAPVASATSAKTLLGAKLYFDKGLSEPDGQACASCHQPFAGYADPDDGLPVSEGVVAGLFGGRNAPSAAYMGKSPVLGLVRRRLDWRCVLGRPGERVGRRQAADRAGQRPVPRPGWRCTTPPGRTSIDDVRSSDYAWLFKSVYGRGRVRRRRRRLPQRRRRDRQVRVVQAGEHLLFALRRLRGRGLRWMLTAKEKRGLALYNGKAICSQCHPSTAAITRGGRSSRTSATTTSGCR